MASPYPDCPTPLGMYGKDSPTPGSIPHKGLSRDTPSTVASTPTPYVPGRSSSRATWEEDGASQKNPNRATRVFQRSHSPGGAALEEIAKKVNAEPVSHLGRFGHTTVAIAKMKSAIGPSWRVASSRRKRSTGNKEKNKYDRLPPAPSVIREASTLSKPNPLSLTGGSKEGTYELKHDRQYGYSRSDTWSAPPTPRRHRPYRGIESERVSRCSREAVWSACDVFWQFDHLRTGEITRKTYIEGLADPPTIEKLRMLRRSQVDYRFRSSAQPVALKEWITMLWPNMCEHDLDLMMRWAELREAYAIVHHKKFRCHETEMNRVYFLIDVEPCCRPNKDSSREDAPRGSGEIPLGELVRARLLTQEEVFKLFRDKKDLHETISKEAFKIQAHPHFKNLYVTADTKSKMKQEEEALQITSSLNTAFGNNLFASQSQAS